MLNIENIDEKYYKVVNGEKWKEFQIKFNKCNNIFVLGHGGNLAVADHAAIDITRLSNGTKNAQCPGSATVVTSTTVGPYVALNADGHQEVPITQLTDVVWGDNRNVTDNPSGDHHFTSHSIGAINLPAGATLQGPIYSFKVVAGSAIGYLSERNYGFQTCPE